MARILLIDDSVHDVEQSTWVLEQGNHTVVSRNAPAPAEALLASGIFDLAIFDMQMHGDEEAGLTLARTARQICPRLPIVILSSGSPAAEAAAKRGEVQGYFPKLAVITAYQAFLRILDKIIATPVK